jgi:hypothetical protein
MRKPRRAQSSLHGDFGISEEGYYAKKQMPGTTDAGVLKSNLCTFINLTLWVLFIPGGKVSILQL